MSRYNVYKNIVYTYILVLQSMCKLYQKKECRNANTQPRRLSDTGGFRPNPKR